MPNYLISGGAGFIGSHVANRLCREGNTVTVIDDLSTGNRKNLDQGVKLIVSDIRKKDFHALIPDAGYNAFLHFAAQSSGEISYEDPRRDFDTNILGTMNCLDLCRKKNIKRFINASSMCIYGNRDDSPVNEKMEPAPIAYYGISKVTTEYLVRMYQKNFGINATSFRLFNVYGPGQNMSNLKQGMVSIYLYFMLFEASLKVKGSFDRYRDFIYIDDVVDVWMMSLDNPVTYGKTYNLGTGSRTTVKELIHLMLDIMGKKGYPVEQAGETPCDIFGLYANREALSRDLNWQPAFSLKKGLEIMIRREQDKLQTEKHRI